jgi:hypothetical protein
MTFSAGIFRKSARLPGFALAAAVLLGGLGQGGVLAAEEPGAVTKALGLRTHVKQSPPDFVTRSRPQSYDFIPVHEPRKLPAGKTMSKAEVESQEKGLDAARRQHDKATGRRTGPSTDRSVAEGMGDPKAKPKKPDACGLTCENPAGQPTRR